MPAYDPQPFIRVNGVTWTGETLEGVSITAGRNDVNEQPRAGYAQVTIVTPDDANYPNIEIDQVIEIGVLDTTAAEKILFTGQVSDLTIGLSSYGETGFLVATTITAVGRLAALNRLAVGSDGYPQQLDGVRVEDIVSDAVALNYTQYGDYYGYDTTNVFRTNLVKNPSFEVDITTNWSYFTGTFTRVTTDSFSGNACFSFSPSGTGQAALLRFINNSTYRVPVTPGDILTASAYFKNTIGTRNIALRIGWYTDATTTTLITTTSTILLNPTNWTRASVTGTAPATAAFAEIRVQPASNGAGGDTFLCDAFLLETGSTLNPYYDGSLGSTLPVIWNGTPHNSTSDIRNNPLGTYPNADTQTWNALDPYLGTFDSGDYELLTYSGGITNSYSLASQAAQSGLGVLYETPDNRIGYSDSGSRLSATNFVDIPANVILANGIQVTERLGDVANDITLTYGTNQSVQDDNQNSIDVYGRIAAKVDTILADTDSAENLLDYYLDTRSFPRRSLNSIVLGLHLDAMENTLRDDLLDVFVGKGIQLRVLPAAIKDGTFTGFVEGWTWTITRNTLFLQLRVSDYEMSVLATQWGQVDPTAAWNTISATLQWQEAQVVN